MTSLLKRQGFWAAILGTIAGLGIITFLTWQSTPQIVDTGDLTNTPSGQPDTQMPVNTAPTRIPLAHDTPNMITIPDREISAPVVYVEETNEAVFQEALAGGVVHYPGTAFPGRPGNTYLFGHSSDYFWKPGDYKQVFRNLVDIPVGTTVRITDADGNLFIYKVTETKVVGPKDVTVLDQQNHERHLMTLQTSWPIGTALKRFIAVCELDEAATYGE